MDSLFKEYEPLNQDKIYEYEQYTKLIYLLKKKDKQQDNIIYLIENFGYADFHFSKERDSLLNVIYSNIHIDRKEYNKHRNQYLRKIDLNTRKKYLELYAKDQYIRRNIKNDVDISNEDIQKIDTDNYMIIDSLLKLEKNHSKKTIGVKEIEYKKFEPIDLTEFWLHQYDYKENRKRIEGYLYGMVKKGQIEPIYLAIVLDRPYLTGEISTPKYYYFMSYLININSNKNEINLSRQSIGLPTIEYEIWKNNK